ncbi:MAG: cysteine-rich small domain-containing protein [Lachnospiraceae bacterium]|nr:cysteine-rich small domain-containing protein [Lachnospiraceae bacterium]
MENSYRYFENRDCKFYPCHKGLEHQNCLFCYCPMYFLDSCLGNPNYIDRDGKHIKDCSNCVVPHKSENYDKIMNYLKGHIG